MKWASEIKYQLHAEVKKAVDIYGKSWNFIRPNAVNAITRRRVAAEDAGKRDWKWNAAKMKEQEQVFTSQ